MTTIMEAAILIGLTLAAVSLSVAVAAMIFQAHNLEQIREIAAENRLPGKCMNASARLWVDLTKAGYRPKICGGNLTSRSSRLEDVDHVWVMVEDTPGHWINVEATVGKIVPAGLEWTYKPAVTFAAPSEMWDTYREVVGHA